MAEVTRSFLETNVLDPTWPKLSVPLQVALTAALQLGVAIEIPEPVRIELEKHWRERTKKKLLEAAGLLKDLGKILGQSDLHSALPNWQAFEDRYKSDVDQLLKQWNIVVTPMPSIAIADVFEQASELALGFGEQGKNFKDVVIFHSVVECLRSLSAEFGLLVSNDGMFSRCADSMQAYASSKGASLSFMKFDKAKSYFIDRTTDAVRNRYNQHKELAKQLITAMLLDFQSVINDNYARVPIRRNNQLLKHVVISKVVDVDVDALKTTPLAGSKVRISAILQGEAEQYMSLDDDGQSLAPLHPFKMTVEAGATVLATYNGSNYTEGEIQTMTWGSPGAVASVGHASIQDAD